MGSGKKKNSVVDGDGIVCFCLIRMGKSTVQPYLIGLYMICTCVGKCCITGTSMLFPSMFLKMLPVSKAIF